ncbi:MAG: glycogen/starch/alpha-glucan phosphorylase, partial [Eubacterium sp.]|nr:glycogen/starch/alpha-glucan phosphorylase [Eubacterium sp.]
MTDSERKEELKKDIENYMKLLFRKSVEDANSQQLFQAVAFAMKDVVVDDWMATHKKYDKDDVKTVYYLSMEFLMGRALGNIIINLKEDKIVREVLDEMGVNLDVLEDEEPDAALGNGGLGRLAACFLDSLSTLGYPAYGCGIRYKYGMFKQEIRDGFQIEAPDDWLKDRNPFEIKRPEYSVEVRFGGYVAVRKDEKTGRDKFFQEDYQSVMAVPYDLPVVGYGNHIVNTLRIWDAEAIDDFNLDH